MISSNYTLNPNYTGSTAVKPCPTCGRCPTCGHQPAHVNLYPPLTGTTTPQPTFT